MTREELFSLRPKLIQQTIYDAVKRKWDSIAKTIDGLGDFEKMIASISAINGDASISRYSKAVIIMCGDHGVVAQGVSQCGQEVTLQVARLLGQNRSSASRLAAFAKADCITVDVGINSTEILPGVINAKVKPGTNDFAVEPAMTEAETLKAIEVGIDIARDCKDKGYNLLASGEMGIGNTTSGTAMLCALTGIDLGSVLGRGAGLSDEGLERKRSVIAKALDMYGFREYNESPEYALEVMSKVGGLELAALTGLFIGGAVYGIPVMIDGVLSAVSALCANRIMPGANSFMIPSHAGREKGTGYVLDILELSPLIKGDMALGEGTGALMTMPLLDMALDFYINATTFEQGNIEQYTRQDGT